MRTDEYRKMFETEDTHWWFQGKRRIVADILSRFLPKRPPRILDYGCGTGATMSFLAHETSVEIYGVDVSKDAISYCRERGLSNVALLEEGTDKPFSGSFDVVLMLDVLEHIEDEQIALEKVVSFLNAGGLVVLTVPAFMFLWSRHDEALHHKRRYTKKQLLSSLKKVGLEVRYISYYNFFLFAPIATTRLIRMLAPAIKEGSDSSALPSRIVNSVLYRIFVLERFFLRAGMKFPFGVSVIAVAQKTDAI